ncbi:hypothetical protein C1701_16880 [Actinoalloteichus sp. AHMU CJ021]|uniref:helix-turn-helix domain-containing protein n=1 Tax=Actinoalloteichus sp. AHMU CJ021 TaxID=2072503 RepID=UPI000CA00430|nr:hypothetical protein C1701_16880 [Actinoalloteichus sp. AHMU CJ021]
MPVEAVLNPVKQRRAELSITQQEAAQRSDVSLATWRRFENTATAANALDGFRPDNLRAFARALKLSVATLRQLITAEPVGDTGTGVSNGPAIVDRQTVEIVRLFNNSFTG